MTAGNPIPHTTVDGTRVHLTPGVLDVDARHALANGLCLEWAIAQAQQHDRHVVMVCDSFNGDLDDDGCRIDRATRHGLHATIATLDGLEDIDGTHSRDTALTWYGPGTYLLDLTVDEARSVAASVIWAQPADARAWAQQLAHTSRHVPA